MTMEVVYSYSTHLSSLSAFLIVVAGFTMYTTCVIWLAFVPLYFGTGNNMAMRITSMSVTISLSASVTIACLFTPKVRCCWLLSGPKSKKLALLLIFEIAIIVMNPTKLERQSLWTILLILQNVRHITN